MKATWIAVATALFGLLLVQDTALSKTYHIYGRTIHGIIIRPGFPRVHGVIIVHPGGIPGPIGVPVKQP
jgi:hypothetical protein